MTLDLFKKNLEQMKKITREIHIFTNQLDIIKNLETSRMFIDSREKSLLIDAIISLTSQLAILNSSLSELVNSIGFYKSLSTKLPSVSSKKLIQVEYKPYDLPEKISLTITDKDRKEFLENLKRSTLSIKQLKKRYTAPLPALELGKPNAYARLSNKFFKKFSNNLIAKGYFNRLNRDLRKINYPFVLGTYVSMIFFTTVLAFVLSILLLFFLMHVKVSFSYPFFFAVEESILLRLAKTFWIMIAFPLASGVLLYFYPSSESKNLGYKINQELPFVVVHISAIASSGIEPTNIFKILLRSQEYRYTNIEFRKIMNLINFHGEDLVTALKEAAASSPSPKLAELLNGLSTTITGGGNLHDYLSEHAESLLFDYRLEREKATRNSETFMDIYIAVVIAAPMILMLMFVIMGTFGTMANLLGLSNFAISFIIILITSILNLFFLIFLRMKQPAM